MHSIVCESGIPGATTGNLQLGSAAVLNSEVYLETGVDPLSVGPGTRSRLQNFRISQ